MIKISDADIKITTKTVKQWSPIAIKIDVPVSAFVAEISTVVCVADVSGSLNDTYFLLEGIVTTTYRRKQFYVWLNVNSAGSDPALTGKTGIEVAVATDATANTVATAVAAAIDGVAEFGAAASTATVTITNAVEGDCDNVVDVDTGFTCAVTTEGTNKGFALINSNQKQFNFAFEFHSIQVIAETNALASILLSINDIIYPEFTFKIDAIESFKEKRTEYANGYYISATIVNEYPFKLAIKRGWTLKIHGRNTHSAVQFVNLVINGWKIFKKRKTIMKEIKDAKIE